MPCCSVKSNILKTTHFLFVLNAIRFNLNYLLFIHTCSSAWKATFIIEKLIWSTYSKRTSGFDMAPPTSAILGATGVAGTLFHVYIINIFNLNFFFPSFLLVLIIVWKIHIKLHGVYCLLGKISFSYYWVYSSGFPWCVILSFFLLSDTILELNGALVFCLVFGVCLFCCMSCLML